MIHVVLIVLRSGTCVNGKNIETGQLLGANAEIAKESIQASSMLVTDSRWRCTRV